MHQCYFYVAINQQMVHIEIFYKTRLIKYYWTVCAAALSNIVFYWTQSWEGKYQ